MLVIASKKCELCKSQVWQATKKQIVATTANYFTLNLLLCASYKASAVRRAVIAREQNERGNPKSKNNAKFMDCHAVFTKTASNDKHKKPKNKALKISKKHNALKNAFCKQKDELKL